MENPAKLTPFPQSLLRLIQCGGKGSRVVVSPHNRGNMKIIFTSWTVYKSFAARMAGRKGWGGIILTKRFKKWQVVLSPDGFNQGEIAERLFPIQNLIIELINQ